MVTEPAGPHSRLLVPAAVGPWRITERWSLPSGPDGPFNNAAGPGGSEWGGAAGNLRSFCFFLGAHSCCLALSDSCPGECGFRLSRISRVSSGEHSIFNVRWLAWWDQRSLPTRRCVSHPHSRRRPLAPKLITLLEVSTLNTSFGRGWWLFGEGKGPGLSLTGSCP